MTPFTRATGLLAAICLVATALLSNLSVLLQPEFAADPADRLATIDSSPVTSTVSLLAFVLAQLPFLVGVVAIAWLAKGAAPRLSAVGGTLAVLGGFGHAVFGGIGLAYLAMSTDSTARAAYADTVTRIESGPAVAFMAAGLLGTVLGLVLLGVALFRGRVVAPWIPITLWAFVVVEFVGANLSEWASVAAGALYLAALGGIAVHVLRTCTMAAWSSHDRRSSPIAVPVPPRPSTR